MIFQREQILRKLNSQLRVKKHIIGVAVGAGITAKYSVRGGADFLFALNSGRFRQMGQSSLAGWMPFANSNDMVMMFAATEIIPVVQEVPVIFGLNATDPMIKLDQYIDEVRRQGFSGINNFPTIGMIDGQFREALEESGISYEREIEAIRIAHDKELFTVAFVFDAWQAQEMVKAGADVICAHLGLTKGGQVGAKKVLSLQAAKGIVNEIFSACNALGSKALKMIYGGPIITPLDLSFMYNYTEAAGYIGGSTFERIPSEDAITNITHAFKQTGYPEQDKLIVKMLDGIKNHYDYVEFVKEYVSANYMNQIIFSDLANVAHVSRTHLSSLFKREVGCTFPEYLTQFRMNKAKEIMKFNKIKLNEVATMVGFQDYAHFSKTFKKVTGSSPEKYQQQSKAVANDSLLSNNTNEHK